MYEHAQKKHKWVQKRKESYKSKHRPSPSEDSNTIAGSDSGGLSEIRAQEEQTEQFMDRLDLGGVPAPQLGAQARVVRRVFTAAAFYTALTIPTSRTLSSLWTCRGDTWISFSLQHIYSHCLHHPGY